MPDKRKHTSSHSSSKKKPKQSNPTLINLLAQIESCCQTGDALQEKNIDLAIKKYEEAVQHYQIIFDNDPNMPEKYDQINQLANIFYNLYVLFQKAQEFTSLLRAKAHLDSAISYFYYLSETDSIHKEKYQNELTICRAELVDLETRIKDMGDEMYKKGEIRDAIIVEEPKLLSNTSQMSVITPTSNNTFFGYDFEKIERSKTQKKSIEFKDQKWVDLSNAALLQIRNLEAELKLEPQSLPTLVGSSSSIDMRQIYDQLQQKLKKLVTQKTLKTYFGEIRDVWQEILKIGKQLNLDDSKLPTHRKFNELTSIESLYQEKYKLQRELELLKLQASRSENANQIEAVNRSRLS